MKKKIVISNMNGVKEREIDYIPIRFILAIALIVLETAAVIAVTMLCGYYIPYFYFLMYATEVFCVLRIINSPENPEYKIPWLLLVLIVPVAGFMIYFMFYNRMLSKKQIKRIDKIKKQQVHTNDETALKRLEAEDKQAYRQAKLLCRLSDTHLYHNT